MNRRPPRSTLFPSPPLFRSGPERRKPRLSRGFLNQAVAGEREARDSRPAAPAHERSHMPAYTVRIEDTADVSTGPDRKSTRLNSSHANISYAVFCLKKKT